MAVSRSIPSQIHPIQPIQPFFIFDNILKKPDRLRLSPTSTQRNFNKEVEKLGGMVGYPGFDHVFRHFFHPDPGSVGGLVGPRAGVPGLLMPDPVFLTENRSQQRPQFRLKHSQPLGHPTPRLTRFIKHAQKRTNLTGESDTPH